MNTSFQNDLNNSQAPLYNVNLPGQYPEHIPLKSEPVTYVMPQAHMGMINPGMPQGPQQQQYFYNNPSFAPMQYQTGPENLQMESPNPFFHGIPPQNMMGYNQPIPAAMMTNPYNQIPSGQQMTINNLPQAIPIKNGYDKLMVPGLFVKQKLEFMEIFSGCETENKYHVYACDVDGQKAGQYIFKCSEKSECLQRNLLSGDCRKFEMHVKHESDGRFNNDGNPFIVIRRPFKCTFACCQRPYVEVELLEGMSTKYVGKIVHDFSCCCNVLMSLTDAHDRIRYRVIGSLCQIGFYASRSCFCRNCQQAFFFIENSEGEKVAVIEKRGKGFKELVSDADNYSVLFPIKANLDDRVLILAATLFLDFRYFEDNAGNSRGGNGLRFNF